MTDVSTPEASVSTSVREEWGSGGIVDMTFAPKVPVNGWRLEISLAGEIIKIWNAEVVSRAGSTYVLGPVDYNVQVQAGTAVELGFQIEGPVEVTPLAIEVALASDVANETAVAPPPPPPPAAPAPAEATGVGARTPPRPDGDPLPATADRLESGVPRLKEATVGGPTAITVTAGDIAETPGTGAGLPGYTFAPGPLSTRGPTIVDADGNPATIYGINWFGLETETFAPHGLWARNWREIMDDVKDLGFNTLRIPFSGALVRAGGGTPSGIDPALNPDLVGLNGLQVLDAVVAYADRIGLRILLDYHRGPPGGGPNDNGLWYGDGFTEADVVAAWREMARRYADSPAVLGADLVNEPHMGTWGDGSATDWAAAAERIGNAVLAAAPGWLIVVEGISTYNGDNYWWGGNLQGVADRPVRLDVPNRLVYSPHDYPASVYDQPWFRDGTDLQEKFRQMWGFIAEEGIAPVLIGEWGSRLELPADLTWARELSAYLRQTEISWLWWSLNPNSGDTGGIFEDDWTTIRQPVVRLLEGFLQETRPPLTFDEAAARANEAVFTVALDAPAEGDLTLKYATADGTAEAGLDYVATGGALFFRSGETEKRVSVPVLPDTEAEGDEFFYLVLAGPAGLSGSGTAVIADDEQRRAAVALPFVDVASTILTPESGAARFRVVLSEPATAPVEIDFTTAADTAPGRATGGTLTIRPGEQEAVLEVGVGEGDPAPGDRRFTLELTAAQGAAIRTGSASAVVVREAPAVAELSARSPTAETQLTIEMILENDWGSGALFNVVLRNVSDTPVNAWQLGLDLPFDLAELWSAVLVADQGERITFRNADWNGTIAPGATVSFGFITDAGGVPIAQIIAGADIELAIQ